MAAERRDRTVGVQREVVAMQYGHWCNVCALPSGIRVWVAYSSTTDPRLLFGEFPHCDECHGRDITVDESKGWD